MKCNVHQEREAVGTCTECGIAFCEDCKVVVQEKNICKKCVDVVVNKVNQKIPGLAAVLSFICPGVGQAYNGQIGKGILIFFTSWLVIPWLYGIYDAYAVAGQMNRGDIEAKKSSGCLIAVLICTVVLIIPSCALISAIAVPNLLRAKISANDALAQSTLRTLSTASETYATANQGHYPSSMMALTDDAIPYLSEDYCGREISGYVYHCELWSEGYTFTATPVTEGTSGTETLTITTGGILSPNRQAEY